MGEEPNHTTARCLVLYKSFSTHWGHKTAESIQFCRLAECRYLPVQTNMAELCKKNPPETVAKLRERKKIVRCNILCKKFLFIVLHICTIEHIVYILSCAEHFPHINRLFSKSSSVSLSALSLLPKIQNRNALSLLLKPTSKPALPSLLLLLAFFPSLAFRFATSSWAPLFSPFFRSFHARKFFTRYFRSYFL